MRKYIDRFNDFVTPLAPAMTFACFLVYSFLWYLGSTVQAWHVLPWIAMVLLDDISSWIHRKYDKTF